MNPVVPKNSQILDEIPILKVISSSRSWFFICITWYFSCAGGQESDISLPTFAYFCPSFFLTSLRVVGGQARVKGQVYLNFFGCKNCLKKRLVFCENLESISKPRFELREWVSPNWDHLGWSFNWWFRTKLPAPERVFFWGIPSACCWR